MAENLVRLRKSKHIVRPNERSLGPAKVDESIRVSIYVQPKSSESDLRRAIKEHVVGQKGPMTREELREVYGADVKEMERIKKYYEQKGLNLVKESQDRRVLIFRGTVEKVNQAFQTTLHTYEADHPKYGKLRYRGSSEDISIPEDMQEKIRVFGLNERPAAEPHISHPRTVPSNAHTPLELAQRYSFPNNVDGSGQTIAIIELGGGYHQADLETYFSDLDISPIPLVTDISVDGSINMPDSPGDEEVELDIEVAGAVAPGANIVVYFALNTLASFLNAVTRAIHDSTHNPSVISISWGKPEDLSIEPWMLEMNQAFQAAALLGITVCVAAGDKGASDGLQGNNVDFPASSPYVLACGGTSLNGDETVWNDGPVSATGGGISIIFPVRDWQRDLSALSISGENVPLANRGLPDVAADADPNTGYWVYVDGRYIVEGGTSAAAPLWAGLVALLNQSFGTNLGYLNPVIYTKIDQNQAFNDITQGDNGGYQATSGWNACTGWGSPNGVQLRDQLSALVDQTQNSLLQV